jgi:hypothetical protein
MRYKGHPVRGAVFGFLTGVFLAIDLMFMGAIPTDSIWVTVLPIAGLVIGLALGWWAPLGRPDASVAGTDRSPFAAPPSQPFVEPPPGAPPSAPVVDPRPDAPSSGDDTVV